MSFVLDIACILADNIRYETRAKNQEEGSQCGARVPTPGPSTSFQSNSRKRYSFLCCDRTQGEKGALRPRSSPAPLPSPLLLLDLGGTRAPSDAHEVCRIILRGTCPNQIVLIARVSKSHMFMRHSPFWASYRGSIVVYAAVIPSEPQKLTRRRRRRQTCCGIRSRESPHEGRSVF
jgi:hypothetical protein